MANETSIREVGWFTYDALRILLNTLTKLVDGENQKDGENQNVVLEDSDFSLTYVRNVPGGSEHDLLAVLQKDSELSQNAIFSGKTNDSISLHAIEDDIKYIHPVKPAFTDSIVSHMQKLDENGQNAIPSYIMLQRVKAETAQLMNYVITHKDYDDKMREIIKEVTQVRENEIPFSQLATERNNSSIITISPIDRAFVMEMQNQDLMNFRYSIENINDSQCSIYTYEQNQGPMISALQSMYIQYPDSMKDKLLEKVDAKIEQMKNVLDVGNDSKKSALIIDGENPDHYIRIDDKGFTSLVSGTDGREIVTNPGYIERQNPHFEAYLYNAIATYGMPIALDTKDKNFNQNLELIKAGELGRYISQNRLSELNHEITVINGKIVGLEKEIKELEGQEHLSNRDRSTLEAKKLELSKNKAILENKTDKLKETEKELQRNVDKDAPVSLDSKINMYQRLFAAQLTTRVVNQQMYEQNNKTLTKEDKDMASRLRLEQDLSTLKDAIANEIQHPDISGDAKAQLMQDAEHINSILGACRSGRPVNEAMKDLSDKNEQGFLDDNFESRLNIARHTLGIEYMESDQERTDAYMRALKDENVRSLAAEDRDSLGKDAARLGISAYICTRLDDIVSEVPETTGAISVRQLEDAQINQLLENREVNVDNREDIIQE